MPARKRGDLPQRDQVRWAEFPEAGRRPVLILTRDRMIGRLTNVTVAPLTRTARGIESEVELTPEQGLPTQCAISLDNLLTIPKSLLGDLITTLDTETMNAVCESIHFALDLPF